MENAVTGIGRFGAPGRASAEILQFRKPFGSVIVTPTAGDIAVTGGQPVVTANDAVGAFPVAGDVTSRFEIGNIAQGGTVQQTFTNLPVRGPWLMDLLLL